jgi:hypothetical protein
LTMQNVYACPYAQYVMLRLKGCLFDLTEQLP